MKALVKADHPMSDQLPRLQAERKKAVTTSKVAAKLSCVFHSALGEEREQRTNASRNSDYTVCRTDSRHGKTTRCCCK